MLPNKEPLRSKYFTVTSEGLIEHRLLPCGGHLVHAPVKLKKSEHRGIEYSKTAKGNPPIPEKRDGHYIWMLPGGEEFIEKAK